MARHYKSEMHGHMSKGAGMISEDRSKACNMPTDVIEKDFPRFDGRPTGRYPDLYSGEMQRMTEDRAYLNRDLKPSKLG